MALGREREGQREKQKSDAAAKSKSVDHRTVDPLRIQGGTNAFLVQLLKLLLRMRTQVNPFACLGNREGPIPETMMMYTRDEVFHQ